MRFSHTADCHLGGHRDARLRSLSEQAFERLVTQSIADQVDFLLVAGDLFNTAIPGIDALKFAVTQLGRLKDARIPVYAIPGSHDYSPSGKTMLDVLERACLLVNVCKGAVTEEGSLRLAFTTDPRTGVKITGVLGRRGVLDREIYEELDRRHLEQEPGTKIFLFHTPLAELRKGADPNAQPLSFLPKGFHYYAGGHVHIVERYSGAGYENIVYPGPLFPNSFSELEELLHGGYYLYDNGQLLRKDLRLRPVFPLLLDVDGMTGPEADAALQEIAGKADVGDGIVTLRIAGRLASGTQSDLDVRSAIRHLEQRGAHLVLRNLAKLSTTEFEAVQLRHEEPKDIEAELLEEHKDQLAIEGLDGTRLARDLMQLLAREPKEGERLGEYREQLTQEALELLDRK